MTSSHAAIVLELDVDESVKDLTEIPEKLVKEYKDLNEKMDKVIAKRKTKKMPRVKKTA